MKPYKRFTSLGALVLLSLSQAHAGGETGTHGGGGVVKKGRYMTFYNAGFYTEPEPRKEIRDIPSLDWLVRFTQWMPFLSPETRRKLTATMAPSPKHLYYAVDEDYFDPITQSRLLEEYHRVTGADIDILRLFAVTDTDKRITYLLPGFFKLKDPKSQAAILFHETEWILHPQFTYDSIVKREMAFEALLNQPLDPDRTDAFLKLITLYPGEQMIFAVNADLASGALKGLLQDGWKLPLASLLGKDTMDCFAHKLPVENDQCYYSLRLHLSGLVRQYPNSRFLALVAENYIAIDGGQLWTSRYCATDYLEFRTVVDTWGGPQDIYMPAVISGTPTVDQSSGGISPSCDYSKKMKFTLERAQEESGIPGHHPY